MASKLTKRANGHALAGPADGQVKGRGQAGSIPRRIPAEDFEEALLLARTLQKSTAIDQSVRVTSLAAEMIDLLADCARGANSFEGAAAPVRRLAALDLIGMATGGLIKEVTENHSSLAKSEPNDLRGRTVGELNEFISAGLARLARLDAAKDAEVIDAESIRTADDSR